MIRILFRQYEIFNCSLTCTNVNKAAKNVCTHMHTEILEQPWGSKFTWHNAVYKRWQILNSHGLWGQVESNQHLFGLTGGMHSVLAEESLTGSVLPLNLNLTIHFPLSYTVLCYPPVQASKSVFLFLLPSSFVLRCFSFQSYHAIKNVPNLLCCTISIKCHGTD